MISVMDLGRLDYSQQSKGNFLYSTATVNSTMDYLIKVIEDNVVNSPQVRGHVLLWELSVAIEGENESCSVDSKFHG